MKHVSALIAAIFFINIPVFASTEPFKLTPAQEQLQQLETKFDGKIGVYAIDTNNNQIIANRADERFPVQSTLKLMGVAALLKQSQNDNKLLVEKIHYTKSDLIAWPWHPVTGRHVANGMTLAGLSEASISYSDNTAMNLIIKQLGGPQVITDFAQSIGNSSFNIEHYEGSLNSDPRVSQDTATPKDMAISVQKLTLGNGLSSSQQTQLVTWMRNNTTGYQRIRAGVPIGWVVADKTGSGDYGVANDIGILWSPTCKPIVLAIYTVGNKADAARREDILASTTQIVLNEFAKNDACFNELFN